MRFEPVHSVMILDGMEIHKRLFTCLPIFLSLFSACIEYNVYRQAIMYNRDWISINRCSLQWKTVNTSKWRCRACLYVWVYMCISVVQSPTCLFAWNRTSFMVPALSQLLIYTLYSIDITSMKHCFNVHEAEADYSIGLFICYACIHSIHSRSGLLLS